MIRRGTISWTPAFLAASLMLLIPSSNLDRGSILTIAGLQLVAVSVTFGVIGIQAQHLAESYPRSVTQATGRDRWVAVLVAQALAVIYVVALSLPFPSLSLGAAAALLLAVGMVKSGLVLRDLLDQFDPVLLASAHRDIALGRLPGSESGRSTRALEATEPLMDLLVKSVQTGDLQALAAATSAIEVVLGAYLSGALLVYNDEFLGWLFARFEDQVRRVIKVSPLAVLPRLVVGVRHLGIRTARNVNALNDSLDEGTYYACRTLHLVAIAGASDRLSPAAAEATNAVGAIADACIDAGKVTTLQEPVRTLSLIGEELLAHPDIAGRACVSLARICLRLATERPTELLGPRVAEDAFEALEKLALADANVHGPAHWLAVTLAENNLARLGYAFATASEIGDSIGATWRELAGRAGRLPHEIAERDGLAAQLRAHAGECNDDLLVALLQLPWSISRMPLMGELADRFVRWPGPRRLRSPEPFRVAEFLLSLYHVGYASESPLIPVQTMLESALEWYEAMTPPEGARFAPAFRFLGVAASARGDQTMALRAARLAIRHGPVAADPVRRSLVDPFFVGLGPQRVIRHTGLPEAPFGPADLEEDALIGYLDFEKQVAAV